jgi:hypothetical protein
MKKWLVGLMAAGLCAASAWAAGVATLPLNVALTDNSTKWTALDGFSGSGVDIYAKGDCKFSKTGNKLAVQFDAAPDTLSFTVKGNSATGGEGTLSFLVEESADGETWSTVKDLSEFTANETTECGPYTLASASRYVRWTYANKVDLNLGLNNVVITSGGPVVFSVSLALSGDSKIEKGSEAYVTATPKNAAEGDVDYEWTSENGGSGEGNKYMIDTSALGDFTVSVTATDADNNVATNSIEFSIVQLYTVSVEDGIQNGTVEIKVGDAEAVPGPVDVKEGTIVTVIATPADRSYQIESITVETEGGTPVGLSKSNTFEMPAENVWVGATFTEKPTVSGDELTRETTGVTGTSYADWTATGASGTEYAGNSAGGNSSIQLNTGSPKGIVITKSAGSDVASVTVEWHEKTADKRSIEIFGSTTAYTGPAALYDDSTKGTSLGEIAKGETTLAVPAGYPYVGIIAKGGALYLPSVVIGFAGSAGPSVSLSASATSVEVREDLTITATATGFSGDVTWSWEGNGTPSGATFAVDTTVDGEYTIKATATCGEETASQEITVTVTPELVAHTVTVTVTEGEGTAEADVPSAKKGETVNLTITPGDGYKVESITVNGTPITGTSFEMLDDDVTVLVAFMLKPVVLGDVLTNTDVGTQSGNYVEWTATKESGAVYAGQSAGGSATNPCIQLRSNNNNSGIVMTKGSGNNVSSVIIEWNAQSANSRVVQVYGSATAYTAPSDLYGNAKGTLLGAVTNGAAEATVDVAAAGEYPFIGVRSKDGAVYLASVTVTFGGEAKPSISGTVENEMFLGGTASATFTLGGATATGWTASLGSISGGEWTWTPSDAGTFTLTVTAAYDGGSAEATYEIVVKDASAYDRFTKVVDIDALEDGEYLVVGASSNQMNFAMTAGLSSGVALGTSVEVKTDEDVPYILTDDANLVWTVTYDESAGLTISSEKDKYLGYDSSKAENKLYSFDAVSDASTWTVAATDGLFTLTSAVQDKDGVDRCLRFNYNGGNTRFAGYKASSSGMKDVALFKKGAAGPKILFEGETSVIMSGGTAAFSLQFSLANYDGDYTWAVTSGKGSIDENGQYTWTATEPGEYSITVAAKSGDDDLATKTVTLKAMDMTPPPGPGDVTLTCEPSPVTMAEGENFIVTLTLTGAELAGGYIYFEGYESEYEEESPAEFDLARLQLTEGEYTLVALAVNGDSDELARTELKVTVTGEGPGPQPGVQPVITSISVAGSQVTLTFTGDGSAVQGADDLAAGNWADVNATIGSGTATVPQAKPYLRIRQ